MRLKSYFLIVLSTILMSSCDRDDDGSSTDVNLFSLEDDKQLGAQVAAEIKSMPQKYPILDSASNVAAYQYIYEMRDAVLNSGEVAFKDEFVWQVRIINDDSTLNAFATPGGYLYFYTGLIKYLDSASQLAGVLGHEIAHADKRHSTDALTRQYGLSILISVVTGGDPGTLSQIATGLAQLKFSRNAEEQADEFSVRYLCETGYESNGAAGFFAKLLNDSGGSCTGQFLSTHPCPDNRVEDINSLAQTLAPCQPYNLPHNISYQDFKNLLP